jgi:hypothetical protein
MAIQKEEKLRQCRLHGVTRLLRKIESMPAQRVQQPPLLETLLILLVPLILADR